MLNSETYALHNKFTATQMILCRQFIYLRQHILLHADRKLLFLVLLGYEIGHIITP